MLTKEQIKSLKPGDPLIIHGTFARMSGKGDIVCCVKSTAILGEVINEFKYIHPSCVSIPSDSQSTATAQLLRSRDGSTVNSQSQYDPTRPFKKGDIVQPRSGKTVLASEYGFVTFHELAGQYEVNEDEARGTVTLIVNGHACFVSAFALDLVTPIEELYPYSIDPANTNVLFKCGKKIATFEDDDEAQELCDRLNEAYGKEHEND